MLDLKILVTLLLALILVCIVQPLFAIQPQRGDIQLLASSNGPITAVPIWGDTKIVATDGGPLKDITAKSGDTITLQAKLYKYKYNEWYPQIGRYLDFYLYSNGKIIWTEQAITNILTENANPWGFSLTMKGTYDLEVKYEGNLKHCSTRAKIYIV